LDISGSETLGRRVPVIGQPLAGATKASFIKKCEADAKEAKGAQQAPLTRTQSA